MAARITRMTPSSPALRPADPPSGEAARGGREDLLTLMTWLSPAFPVGAFAWSHGLEAAINEGRVAGAADLAEWVETLLLVGSVWNDLVLFAEGFHAVRDGDQARFATASELAEALAGSAERRAETQALGAAFGAAVRPWQGEADAAMPAAPYPLAVARAAAANGIALQAGLVAFAHGFASGLVSAAVRLVPLGQGDAVGVMMRLEPVLLRAAALGERSTLDDLGSAAIVSDIAAMRHETLATRLFRS